MPTQCHNLQGFAHVLRFYKISVRIIGYNLQIITMKLQSKLIPKNIYYPLQKPALTSDILAISDLRYAIHM